MLQILAFLACGIGCGVALRRFKLKFIPHLCMGLIYVLLFLLGLEVGGNPRIIHGLATIGLDALILTAGGVAGSLAGAYLVGKLVRQRGENR